MGGAVDFQSRKKEAFWLVGFKLCFEPPQMCMISKISNRQRF